MGEQRWRDRKGTMNKTAMTKCASRLGRPPTHAPEERL